MNAYFRRAAARLSRLGRSEQGAIVVPVALVTVPLIAAVVAGVDYARILAVQSRLQTAVDAAALVAARPTNTSTAFADATALYYSNFGRTDKNTGASFMTTVASAPTVAQVDAFTVKVSATVTLPQSLWSAMTGNQPITATSIAKRYGMELALVLDVTGSMKSNDNIGGLRVAAKNLIDILYGTAETKPDLWVSIVPYTASVNLGSSRTTWLKAGSLDGNLYLNGAWNGCVEARTGTQDRTDATPTEAPFIPYFWASTFEKYKNGNSFVKGDNDWRPAVITEANQATLPDNTAVGPNLGCNAFPVVPLTTSKTTLLTTINALKETFRGGTMANLGLQAGWFTLSPKWQGVWDSSASPKPYNTANMDKIVVMMTDGNNEWYDWPDGAPGAGPTHTGQTTNDADYTGYGRLADNRLGLASVSNSNARTEINNRSVALCTAMKAQGIKIYTVVLGNVDASTKALWQGCATKPDYYFNSPDKAALASAFTEIGLRLASLRISQ